MKIFCLCLTCLFTLGSDCDIPPPPPKPQDTPLVITKTYTGDLGSIINICEVTIDGHDYLVFSNTYDKGGICHKANCSGCK